MLMNDWDNPTPLFRSEMENAAGGAQALGPEGGIFIARGRTNIPVFVFLPSVKKPDLSFVLQFTAAGDKYTYLLDKLRLS